MKRRDKIIIGIVAACLAVAAGTWMDVRQGRRMHAALELALAQNRSGVPFRSDTIYLDADSTDAVTLHHVVDFYRHPLRSFLTRHASFLTPHSSLKSEADNSSFVTHHSSFLMQSLYVLGCAYRDLHEAPIAIITWEDAVAAADTTADDCDYATLFRVYGQMAEVYFRQYMPEKQLEAQQKCSDYALMAGDTLNYIKCLLPKNDAYLSLGDTAAVFENIQHVRQLYLERGLKQEAAQVYPSAIHIALDRGEYAKADSMMQIYEMESGLFDEQGNIAPTREKYYYQKGRYYAGIGLLDSAEIQFRKLLPFADNKVDACHGLLFLFQYQQQADSVTKYALLYDNALANYLNHTQTEAISQADAMYNFQRQMQIAQKEEQKANRWRFFGILGTLMASIIALTIYLIAKEEKKRKEKELQHLTATYFLTLEQLNQAQTESVELQRSLSDKDTLEKLSQEKTEQVLLLETKVEDLRNQIETLQDTATRLTLKESTLIQHFQNIAKSHGQKGAGRKITFEDGRNASTKEWEQMLEMVQESHPRLYLVLKETTLTETQLKVCLLSRYGFNNEEMATLIPLDIKTVSNIRTKLAKETFHLNSAYDLNKYLISIP